MAPRERGRRALTLLLSKQLHGLSMRKSRIAFEFSAENLAKKGLYMWTFTFAEVLPIKETRKRWNRLLTSLRRRWPELCGLRVFELHKTHGLHVHLVTDRFIRVQETRELAKKAGWGRVHVTRANAGAARYLAKYLSKEREPCFKGWRLWSGFGEWDWSRVKDILVESPKRAIWDACAKALNWKGNRGFFERRATVDHLYLRAIEEGWKIKLDSFRAEGEEIEPSRATSASSSKTSNSTCQGRGFTSLAKQPSDEKETAACRKECRSSKTSTTRVLK